MSDDLDVGTKQARAPPAAFATPRVRRGPVQRFRARAEDAEAPRPAIIEDSIGSVTIAAPRARPSAYLVSFILFVVIPSIVATLYFAFLASDQFVAEARFAVRSAQVDSASLDNMKSAMSSASASMSVPSIAGQDAYIIAAYIRSRAIVDDLSKGLDLRAIFRRPEADF
jgi:hypothetical protein